MKKLLITFLLLISIIDLSLACSCNDYLLDLPIKEMGWTESNSERISSISDLIFTGVLLEYYLIEEEELSHLKYKSKISRYELVFKLIKSYKGEKQDTVRIRTNRYSSSCGFEVRVNTECLIFANYGNQGFYYTYRSDCCKSISKALDEKRFNKYVKFLDSIINMIDGQYDFKQSRTYWHRGGQNQMDTLDLISYTIKDGKFEGKWRITDRRGRILEEGQYEKGKKIGLWKVFSVNEVDSVIDSFKTELIEYNAGRPIKSKIVIEDKKYIYEKGHYEIVRVENIVKEYKYEK